MQRLKRVPQQAEPRQHFQFNNINPARGNVQLRTGSNAAFFLNINMLFFSTATCCFLTDNVLFFNFSQQQCAVFLNCFVLFFLLAHVLEISVLFNFCFIHSCRHSCKSNNDVMMTQIFNSYFKSFSSHLPSYEEDALDTGDPRENIQMQIYQL